MSEWKQKRFWKEAMAIAADGGYAVHLDGRPVKTPAKAGLILPTKAMAEAVAVEWGSQSDVIDPSTMPVTRSANAAIDKVRVQRDEVIALLAEYGDSDLLCYRAAGPEGLVKQQVAAWDPLLDWAAESLNARLWIGEGVMHVAQDAKVLSRLTDEVAAFDDFALAAAHDLISLSGSLVIALAVTRAHLMPGAAWDVSRVDEDWQIAQWGDDEEAREMTKVKRAAFFDAARFYQLSLK